MNCQGHGHSEEFNVGYWKQPVKGGLVLFMTDVLGNSFLCDNASNSY